MKKETKNIIITAGGTTEKIDEVRMITNFSTGRLGSLICTELLKSKEVNINKIFYMCSENAIKPNPEILASKKNLVEFIYISDVESLKNAIEKVMSEHTIDYFIHSAAISDYTTDYVSDTSMLSHEIADKIRDDFSKGNVLIEDSSFYNYIEDIINKNVSVFDRKSKVSSDVSNPIIKLKQTPKIISLIKKLQPQTFLVGFKLLKNVTDDELFNVAFKLLRKNHCNMVLANDLSKISKDEHEGMIVLPEKSYEKYYGKESIAKNLVHIMLKRGNTRKTSNLSLSDEAEKFHFMKDKNDEVIKAPLTDIYNDFYEIGNKMFKKNLLPIVDGGTYGNMSIKTIEKGMIITGCNVHKGNLNIDDIVQISTVETFDNSFNNKIYAKIYYKGNKRPSTDTAIHHYIYENTSFKAIIHIHTDNIFNLPITDYSYACGTEKEMQSIMDILKENKKQNIIQLKNHGLIVMGETLNDCYEKILSTMKMPNIRKISTKHDPLILNEWKNHLKETDSENVKLNINDFYVYQEGQEKIALVYLAKERDKVLFLLYKLNMYRNIKSGVTNKVFSIVKNICKSNGINNITVMTKEECKVKDYYVKRHGFKEVDKIDGIFYLEKKI